MIFDKRLWLEATRHKKRLLAVTGLSLIGGILVIGQAVCLARIINATFLAGSDILGVSNELTWLAVIIILRALNIWLTEMTADTLASKIKTSLNDRLAKKIFELGPIYMARQEAGNIINLLTEGIQALEPYFARFLPQLITTALTPVLILTVVLSLEPPAALILLITAPLIPFFMILIGKIAENKNKAQFEDLSKLNSHFLDILQGLSTLKLFGRSKEQAKVIARIAGQFRDSSLAVLKIAFLSTFVLELAATISTALVAVTIGLKVLYGHSLFLKAFLVLLLTPEFYLPFRLLGVHYHAAMGATAAADKIYAILNTSSVKITDGGFKFILARKENLSITFENVRFSYDNSLRPALDGLSFTIGAGEKVALIGASGAGKSTVASLLLKFISAQGGTITVNGNLLNDIKQTDWLANVAYVPQQPHLFYATVADNIRFGSNAPLSEVIAAAQQAQIHDFISQLPDGYDTIIGQGGRSLSGGQSQLLVIARAFLRLAGISGIVIFDEATGGLDPRTQAAVTQAAWRLFAGRTALIIAHRLSTVSACDKIIVLKDGKAAGCGSHGQLSSNNVIYRQMTMAAQGG